MVDTFLEKMDRSLAKSNPTGQTGGMAPSGALSLIAVMIMTPREQ